MIGIINNTLVRWLSIFILGAIFRFSLDIIFSLLYRNYLLFQPFESYLFTIIFTFLVFETIFFLNRFIRKRIGWNNNPYKQLLIQWVSDLGIAFFYTFVLRWIFVLIFIQFTYVNLFDEIVILVFVLLITTAIIVGDLSMFLLRKWRFSLAELERFKKENAEFRFEFLQAQVNPHFLFNSLNTLSSLVYENKEKAASFIRELSDVYRYILENRDREVIKLDEELEMLKSYVYLIQLRFEQNLNISFDITPNRKGLLIAPLTLQMLVENATKHNVISRKNPLNIHIFTENNYIIVRNNLQKKELKKYTSKLGLKNIRNRYDYLTDRKLEMIENTNEYIVKVPLIQEA